MIGAGIFLIYYFENGFKKLMRKLKTILEQRRNVEDIRNL